MTIVKRLFKSYFKTASQVIRLIAASPICRDASQATAATTTSTATLPPLEQRQQRHRHDQHRRQRQQRRQLRRHVVRSLPEKHCRQQQRRQYSG